jgi:16S rRNA (cytosine967-C5)-methyltransferase
MDGPRVSVTPARRAALDTLARVRQRSAYARETLDAVVSGRSLSPEDRALAARLAYGVLSTQGVLDEAIDRLADRPGRIEPRVRDALRLAAYEMLYTRLPARATVNEAVEAVRGVSPGLAGFANAVLRRLSGEAADFPWGDPDTDTAALARLTGHPAWIAQLVEEDWGRSVAAAFMRADAGTAPLYVWHDPFRGGLTGALQVLETDGAAPTEAEPPGCIVCGVPGAAVRGRALADGLVLVADAAAQLAARVLRPAPGSTVVDLAAGRGTKTVQLQALAVAAGGPAHVFAIDLHPFKIQESERRFAGIGVPDVTALALDATDATALDAALPDGADSVLVDAPCSGLGTLRRRVDKRWRLAPADVDALRPLQAGMLEAGARLVRPGGTVVYSTCSVARRENHYIVREFLASDAGRAFRTRDISADVPVPWRRWIGPEGWFQSMPETDGPDGHFVAALEKTG